ncbi:hypothetical protein [Amycolatopsis sp. NPDC051371]|uniref:hypothetical protein n=1 Tax=Amycolatopsis sp. NPDC051371 TaxID=3155800 RepID=UPI00342E02A7
MSLSAACTVWRVQRVDDVRHRVEYCCRGGPAGTFDVMLAPGLRDVVDLPPVADTDLVLAAAGIVLDGVLPAGAGVPLEIDLTTRARLDPGFVPELRHRLNVPDPVPRPR